jgi:isoamylase
MLSMGDEVRRSQQGNNNAYCQDSAVSWFDWDLVERHRDLRRFVKALNEFRQRRVLVDDAAALTLNELLARAKLQWHGVQLHQPDWNDNSHSLAFTIQSRRGRIRLHGILNAYWEPLTFALPPAVDGHQWRLCIDTAQAAPHDIRPLEEAPIVAVGDIVAQPRSVVVLAQIVGAAGFLEAHAGTGGR